MAAARPPTDAPVPQDDPDAPARAELARLLLEGARRLRLEGERPPPWPERDPAEDLEAPAIVRKAARARRRAQRAPAPREAGA